ncbi:MAG: hydroxyacid dehydrogenase [Bergeyella sp.]|nr:hydroxyacid dehydrogenase [Bergeyella sp.]
MNILLLDRNHPLIPEQLRAKGYRIREDYISSYEDLLTRVFDVEGIIIRSRIPIDEKFIRHAPQLKFIARVGAGLENIDTDIAKEKGIFVFNSPEGNRDTLAEHVVGMLLVLMNRLFISSQEVKNGLWLREENRGEELLGKTIGIIGYGHMGKAVAKRLSGFGCEVVFHDILPNLADSHAREVSMEELQQTADILSLHVPLNAGTFYMVNENFIEGMKKAFYFINTARGKNVNTHDLVKALQSGKIKGAALDVLEYEKSSFENLEGKKNEDLSFLLRSEKVLLTPHIAGWSVQSKEKLARYIVDKIISRFS